MVVGEVVIKLPMNDPLNYFGDDRNERDGSEIGRVRGVTGFEKRLDNGVFPRIGDIGLGYGRVDYVKDDVTDSWETGLQHADAHSVSTAGSGTPHADDRVTE